MSQSDDYLDNIAEFIEDRLLIAAITTTIKETRSTTDEALVLVRPFNYFHAAHAFFYRNLSWERRRPARPGLIRRISPGIE